MRTSLVQFCRRLLNGGLLMLALGFAFPSAVRATDELWSNSGAIYEAPQIDAYHVYNDGLIDLITGLPFESANTLTVTNLGTMRCKPGWFFNYAPTTIGKRSASSIFMNQSGGIVEAMDPTNSFFIIGQPGGTIDPSYIWITATNVINRGALRVGANGWLKIAGTNVDLSRSAVEVTSIVPVGSYNGQTNFIPDAGINDLYWAVTNVGFPPGIPTQVIFDGNFATAPTHDITLAPPMMPRNRRWAFQMLAAFADSYGQTNGFIDVTVTNLVGLTNLPSGPTVTNLSETNIVVEVIRVPTNVTRQACFVGSSDPSMLYANIYWQNSSNPTNVYKTPLVEYVFVSQNNVSGSQGTDTLYVYDTFASEAERGLLRNVNSPINLDTYRPTNYIVSRLPMAGFVMTGDGYPDRNYLWNPAFTNGFCAAETAAYGAYIANLPGTPPIHPSATYTNLAGRVQIYADTLDMSRTRVRGQGEVSINAKHLISSANASVDSPNLGFNLASTNNSLIFTNLAATSVDRLDGDLYIYSAIWQNVAVLYSESWTITTNLDTNGVITSLDATYSPATNSCDFSLATTLVNGEGLMTSLPVYVWDITLYNENVTVGDNMNVVHSFYTDAKNLTVSGGISFGDGSWRTPLWTASFPGMQDFIYTNAPNLQNFTNAGLFSIPNRIHFGDDRPSPLQSFVNTGTFNSFTIGVDANYFRNSGSFACNGAMDVEAGTVYLESGFSQGRNTSIACDGLRMNNYRLTANGTLNLAVTSLLTDAGTAGATNYISLFNGVTVSPKPASGDLLVTGMRSSLRAYAETYHRWPAIDRGAAPEGYFNNLALGKLGFAGSVAQDPVAVFAGTGPKNALYVDLLDLTGLATYYSNVLSFSPSMTLYYSAAKLSFQPPPAANGVAQTPEEYLDGQFGGRLKWVSSYAGIYSSVAVVKDGESIMMNAGLRNSRLIDSDADGVPNYYDTTPLGGDTQTPPGGSLVLSPSFVNPGAGARTFGITWDAAANTAYQVEVATDLLKGDWQVLENFTNTATIGKKVTVMDPAAAQVGQRFYRIRLKQ